MVQALRDGPLLIWLRVAHVLGACVLVGAVLLFDARVLGVNRSLSLRGLSRHLLLPAVAMLAIVVPSGLLLFITRASELLASGVFLVKILLLFAIPLLAAGFMLGPWRGVAAWDSNAHAPAMARLLALLSIVGWLVVVVCGVMLRPD